MSPRLRYASYVAWQKWFVLLAGLKVKAPPWRLLIHDWSKLRPAEWEPYVTNFYRRGEATVGGATEPPACYRASWQLPGPDSHRQATTSLRESATHFANESLVDHANTVTRMAD